ncbi:MAG: TatD family hydrolase [Dehalococcoidia bacterium]|nr:TatD family hydrolase [Dehalococcoidia bacterium]
MRLFDSHSHLQDAKFGDETAAVIARSREAGVAGILLCGYDAASNEQALAIAGTNPGVFPAVGYHPHEAGTVTAGMLAELESLAARPEVVCVGEIGLDHYWGTTDPGEQRELLEAQLDIALRVGKPVSLHSRSAEDAMAEVLAPYAGRARTAGTVPGVMHCFGGTLEQAERYTELGFLVSIACVVTYPKNDEARRLAAGLPLDAILVETDSPYLPPQRLRGKRNEPAFVRDAVEAIAAVRGVPAAEIAEATTRNAERTFGVRALALAEVA